VLQQKGEHQAQIHVGDMKHGKVIEIDESLALSAAGSRLNSNCPWRIV